MKSTAIFFKPNKWSANRLDGLRLYSTLVTNACSLTQPEEHDSSHYIENTYFRWEAPDIDLRLYWGDDEDTEELLCLEVRAYADPIKITKDLAQRLEPLAETIKIEI